MPQTVETTVTARRTRTWQRLFAELNLACLDFCEAKIAADEPADKMTSYNVTLTIMFFGRSWTLVSFGSRRRLGWDIGNVDGYEVRIFPTGLILVRSIFSQADGQTDRSGTDRFFVPVKVLGREALSSRWLERVINRIDIHIELTEDAADYDATY